MQNSPFNVRPGARLSGLGKAPSLPILGDSWSLDNIIQAPGWGWEWEWEWARSFPGVSDVQRRPAASMHLEWGGAYLLCASPCLKPSRSTSCTPHLCPASTGPSCWNTSHWPKLAWQISRCLPLAGGQIAEGGRRSSLHPPSTCPRPSVLPRPFSSFCLSPQVSLEDMGLYENLSSAKEASQVWTQTPAQ